MMMRRDPYWDPSPDGRVQAPPTHLELRVYPITDEQRRLCYMAAVECRCTNTERRSLMKLDRSPRYELPELEHLVRRPPEASGGSLDTIELTTDEWAGLIESLEHKAQWLRTSKGPNRRECAVYGYREWKDIATDYEELARLMKETKPIQ